MTTHLPAQPIATINGEAVIDLPKDLYIPPEAMKVFLKAFEGPLDFLLYLIRKQNIDILDIPIASVTRQYMDYINLMQDLSLELAAEYLVMAAILAEIKSRLLLPRPQLDEEMEEDPRAELVRRLQEYEVYKKAAYELDKLPQLGRDTFSVQADKRTITVEKLLPNIVLQDLVTALEEVLQRAKLSAAHHIQLEGLSVREKMSYILETLHSKEHFPFAELFAKNEGRTGIVVTFLALLELLKERLVEFIQASPFSPIYLRDQMGD